METIRPPRLFSHYTIQTTPDGDSMWRVELPHVVERDSDTATARERMAQIRRRTADVLDAMVAAERAVGCSHCGDKFPPLAPPFDTGFSHCDQHQRRVVRAADETRVMP